MALPEGTHIREFVCRDCNTPVILLMPVHDNDQDICSMCIWLRDIEDIGERDALRKFLKLGGPDERGTTPRD